MLFFSKAFLPTILAVFVLSSSDTANFRVAADLPQDDTSSAPANITQLGPEATTDPPSLPETPPTTLAPTESPTESPAPSPSPSEAPTTAPTGSPPPTGTPTESPTESPAPSPSPSETPTMAPTDMPSAHPSGAPTISPQPTTTPSVSPSHAPSTSPTISPSHSPTISFAPTGSPSYAPSERPSSTPSSFPSNAPTVSANPSNSPTISPAPTTTPSEAPTSTPSVSPTNNPTDVTYRTKTELTDVLLLGIEDKMEGEIIGDFEIATLEFILASKPPTPGFEIDLVAVTVLKQTHVDVENGGDVVALGGGRRNLDDGEDKPVRGLQVEFRTVGIVTSGHMGGMLFENITEQGFVNNYDGFLSALSQKNDFFSVLNPNIQMLQAAAKEPEEKSKGTFVVAILFSSVAFIIAIFASYYAIKKHMQTGKRRHVDKMMMLEYPGITQGSTGVSGSSSEDEMDDPRTMNGKLPMALQLDIDDEKVEMEEIGLSPMAGLASMMQHSPFSSIDERRPLSPRQMEEGAGRTSLSASLGRTSLGGMSEESAGLKKWLTPREGLYNWMTGTPKNDPPESDSSSFRPSYDPGSRKISTTTDIGIIQQDRRDTIGGVSYSSKTSFNGESKRNQVSYV